MAENVKLKDLYADEKVYDGINTVKIPKADGTGNAKFIIPPSQKFMLRESDYQEDYVQGSGTTIAVSENDESGGFVFANIANAMMHMSEPKIIRVAAFAKDPEGFVAYHSMEEQTITEFMTRIFQSEAEESVVVTPDTYVVKKGWTNIISTATTEGNIVRVTIEKFEQITDPSTFTFDASLPWYINKGKENYFYSYIAEATQQMKSVSVTENGTQIINPDSGKSGLTAVQLSVDVAGGGGASVQPDYAQNNTTAADYIKNRPGGYTVENPAISKTIAASDYVSTAIGRAYKFSDVILPDEAIVGGTGKVTTVGSDGAATEHDISSIVFDSEYLGSRFYMVSIAGSTETLNIFSGASQIGDGVYFSAILQDTTVTAYISEFTTAAYSTTVEIPEKFTEVKPADWGASYGEDGYVAGRVGGYFLTETDFVKIMSGSYKYSWDGVIGDKETVYARINLPGGSLSFRYVKVSDETFAVLLSVGAHITSINTSNGEPDEFAATRENLSIGKFGTISIDEVNIEIPFRVPMVVISYSNHAMTEMGGTTVSFTQGIWFAQNLNNDGTAKGYVSELALSVESGKAYPFMPYEFVEQNPSTLTTDAQTLTGAQKLQARANIGTVEGTDKEMILSSSTAGSTKKFKITVTDDGTLTATEVTQ